MYKPLLGIKFIRFLSWFNWSLQGAVRRQSRDRIRWNKCNIAARTMTWSALRRDFAVAHCSLEEAEITIFDRLLDWNGKIN